MFLLFAKIEEYPLNLKTILTWKKFLNRVKCHLLAYLSKSLNSSYLLVGLFIDCVVLR